MLIPSESTRRVLGRLRWGFLFEPVNFGTSVVLMAKLPYEQIDCLWDGAAMRLAVDFVETPRGSFLWSALTIVDHESAMFYLQRTHRHEQLREILAFLGDGRIEVAAFDELNRCVGSLLGHTDGAQAVMERLTSWNGELAQDEADDIEAALEARGDEIGRHPELLGQLEFRFTKRVVVELFSAASVPSPAFDPGRAQAGLRFDERDVGLALEIDITRLMSTVFPPDSLFPSPAIGSGTRARELIDVVAIAPGALIFVEAKAVQTRSGTYLSRREANGQKSLTRRSNSFKVPAGGPGRRAR
jgi:hypothetical protein